MIELRALGAAEIRTDLTVITPSQEIVFAAALYLILERGTPVSRIHLASLLWPHGNDGSRRHRLRQTILQLKKLGFSCHADRTHIRLSKDAAISDSDHISNQVGTGTPLEFMPGYAPMCSEALRDWLDAKRRECHVELSRILTKELGLRRLHGDWQGIEEIATTCLKLDPFNEIAVLGQAEAAAMRGAKREALNLLDRYIAEVGVRETQLTIPASVLRRRVVAKIPERGVLSSPEPDFVARELELEILTRAFEGARTGKGSAIAVVGEPGIGKSRLAAEVGRFVELQGGQVQRAKCRLADLDRPLSLFVDLVPELRELPGALGCEPETLASLKRLTEFEQRTIGVSNPTDSMALFQSIREALFDLLASVTEERCLVLIIEDVHWLDVASAKILAQLCDWCATKRLLLIINSRPTSSLFTEYIQKAHLPTIKLDALPNEASSTLLKSVVLRLGDAIQAEFVDWCLSVAEGNPFFLQELAHHWIETGHRYEAPPSVSSVLQERLSRVTPGALQVLQTCALLGDFATVSRVERVLEYPPHQLLSAIQELSNASMLGAQGAVPESSSSRLQPRHDFLASAAINLLAPVSVAFLHRRAADILDEEVSRSAMPAALLWACANHSHRAGDKKRALSLALSCARHLLDMGLAGAACKRYEDSLAYCVSDEDRLSVLGPLAVAYQIEGLWDRSKDVLRRCIKLSSGAGDNETHHEFEIQLLMARFRSDLDFVALLADLLPYVGNHKLSPQHRVTAGVVALKAASDVGPTNVIDTIYHEIKPFLQLSTVDKASRLEAEIIYRTMRTNEDLDIELLERFTQTARSLHGEMAYAQALLAASSACRISARDDDAIRFSALALNHAIEHKMRARIPLIKLTEVRLHVSAENWPAARAAVSGLDGYPIPSDDRNTRAEWDFYAARVALHDGDLSRAEELIERLGGVPQSFSPNRRSACLAIRLRLYLECGDRLHLIPAIVRDLDATHTINRNIGNQDYEAFALFLGFSELGESEIGWCKLLSYVHTYRMTRRPLSPEIREVLSKPKAGRDQIPKREAVQTLE